jgi:hypothetical protein
MIMAVRLKRMVYKCAARNIPVSWALVQEHAQEVAKTMGKSEFGASNGRLESFRERHQVAFNGVYGDACNVC